ncbi:MAG: ferrous iron transport protein B [Anaerovorax sp.]|nr:ferrous iron transport protein B [Anaerovorax sp.]
MEEAIIALAGNPNVGKSTVFNALTGLHQHTGNWPGKTVANAMGSYTYQEKNITVVDLPGTYSLIASSVEEEVSRDYICSDEADIIVCITDATCLKRNLNLVLQILSTTKNVIVCVNLLDEAKKKGIAIDLPCLSMELGVPVIGTSARSNEGLLQLKDAINKSIEEKKEHSNTHTKEKKECIAAFDRNADCESITVQLVQQSEAICSRCIKTNKKNPHSMDRKIDHILTSKTFGIPIMLGLLCLIFWITITGANYPSQILSNAFQKLGANISSLMQSYQVPVWVHGILMDGIYKTVTWVVSVMLPPMAIFFPLFTLLEDSGYLPRIAFNLDHFFQKANAHGKQSLTMCMGFGCNACGVIGCRIIDSPRERLIAILTNNFVPCNGRFPTLIAIITMFYVGNGSKMGKTILPALLLTAVILLGIVMTILISKLLSKTILKGMPSSFSLELPPYRCPQFGKVIVRSIFDRTLFVLGRAIVVAAPAGLLIWILANVTVGNMSLLDHFSQFLDPFASLFGIDGVILMAFLLGFPANEIVIPIILMAYLSMGTLTELESLNELHALLLANGWTGITALCTMILCLMHFPCGTTCLTIKKETQSWKWTIVAFILPTLCGLFLCFLISTTAKIIF